MPVLLVATYRDDELDRAHPLRVALGDLLRREAVKRVRLRAALARGGGGAGGAARRRRRRAAPPHRRQSVLRHRGSGGRRRRAARDDPRRRAGPRRAAERAGAKGGRRGGDRAGHRRASRSSRRSPATPSPISGSASRAACSERSAAASRSGTSWRAWRSRRRWRPISGWRCTGARSPHSPARTLRAARTTPKAPPTPPPCCGSRPPPPSAPPRPPAPTTRPPRNTAAPCGSPTGLGPPSAHTCTSAARTSRSSPTQPGVAAEELRHALECHRGLGDRRAEGDALRRLSNIVWCPGDSDGATVAGRESVAVLEPLGAGAGARARVREHGVAGDERRGRRRRRALERPRAGPRGPPR